jgi:hypothetical protein
MSLRAVAAAILLIASSGPAQAGRGDHGPAQAGRYDDHGPAQAGRYGDHGPAQARRCDDSTFVVSGFSRTPQANPTRTGTFVEKVACANDATQ